MKAMVLAAGVGSRLDPLTTHLPKPLVPVANVAVIDHTIELLSRHGVKEIIANLHYLPELIQKHFAGRDPYGCSLTFRYEEELTGDAGGVRTCRDFLDDDTFIVIMGDLITDCDLSRLLEEHKSKKALATIGVKKVPNVEHFGVVVQDSEGFITGFQEKPSRKEARSDMASAGIYILEPQVFEHMPASGSYGFGRQLFPKLVDAKLPVLGVDIMSYWSDIGTIGQYRQSNLDVLEGRINLDIPGNKEEKGKTIIWSGDASISQAADIQGRLLIGAGSRIEAGARIEGTVVIGENCLVEENVVLKDSVVWSGARLGAGAVLTDSIIGLNSEVKHGVTVHDTAVQTRTAAELSS